MAYIVCCPTSLGGTSHMTFSAPFISQTEADKYCKILQTQDTLTAKYKGPWGKESTLYILSHPLYTNTRPPHVANANSNKDINIYLKQAYVYKIKKM